MNFFDQDDSSMEIDDQAVPVCVLDYEDEFSVPSFSENPELKEIQDEQYYEEVDWQDEGESFTVYRDTTEDDEAMVESLAVGVSHIIFEIPEEEQDGITEFTVHPDLWQ